MNHSKKPQNMEQAIEATIAKAIRTVKLMMEEQGYSAERALETYKAKSSLGVKSWEKVQNEVLGKSFEIGQKFTFEMGQRVVANGYQGNVAEVENECGMLVVRLNSGRTLVPATYPNVYPF